jgi:ribosomal protein S6--L-glutamate ligase
MILSYHPCFKADKNMICAGREPDADDLAEIAAAHAVILPQGCRRSLYEMAHNNCGHVFPNFDSRFQYSGKIGQVRLFQENNVPHPRTETYPNLNTFVKHYGGLAATPAFDFPFVFKFDWGGEGYQVYLIESASEFKDLLQTAGDYEHSGHAGFLIQEYIPSTHRSLRVVVIGQTIISYWRVQSGNRSFCSNLARGAVIDANSDPELQTLAKTSVKAFCTRTGINLAGFDLIFSSQRKRSIPLFLEINYYFGRRGLGGSERFYEILIAEIEKWIDRIGLKSARISKHGTICNRSG